MTKVKTLIVEDDRIMAFLHKELLKKHEVSTSPLVFMNGKEALNFLLSESYKSASYLILLDLNMPVMNGWEFLDELETTEIASRTKVAIVTSSIDRADMRKAEQYKVVDIYLTKPINDLSPIQKAVDQLKRTQDKKLNN